MRFKRIAVVILTLFVPPIATHAQEAEVSTEEVVWTLKEYSLEENERYSCSYSIKGCTVYVFREGGVFVFLYDQETGTQQTVEVRGTRMISSCTTREGRVYLLHPRSTRDGGVRQGCPGGDIFRNQCRDQARHLPSEVRAMFGVYYGLRDDSDKTEED